MVSVGGQLRILCNDAACISGAACRSNRYDLRLCSLDSKDR